MDLLEYLISILGEEDGKKAYDKISKDKKHNVLVDDKNDSKYVEKNTYNEVVADRDNLKKQNKQKDKDLEELKKSVKDNEELTNKIEELQKANKEAEENHNKKIEQMKFDYAVENALKSANPKNVKALKGLIDFNKVKLVDDKLIGLDEQVEALKKSDDYMFNIEKTGTGRVKQGESNPLGINSNNGNSDNNGGSNNSFIDSIIKSKGETDTKVLDSFFE